MKLQLPSGLATALGALPGVPIEQAAALISDWLPLMPSAPTMPPLFRVVDLTDAASTEVAPDALTSLRTFLEGLGAATTTVALSCIGPVTTQLKLAAEGVDRVDAAVLARDGVEAQVHDMIEVAHEVHPDSSFVVIMEEPSLANSMHPTFPLHPQQIRSQLESVIASASESAAFGVHVNGRADWAMLLGTGISVLCAPVSGGLETAADEIETFLNAGGFIAWGAVPTDEPLGSNADRLWKRLSAVWAELASLGLDPLLLRERSIITPSAELANFGLAQAEQVLRLTVSISEKVTRQITGARLSIGA